jgi:hypothetical protein
MNYEFKFFNKFQKKDFFFINILNKNSGEISYKLKKNIFINLILRK